MARKSKSTIDGPADIVVSALGPSNSLPFNEFDFQNWGNFVPFAIDYGRAVGDANERYTAYDREKTMAQSRNYVEKIPEISAAFQRLADFVVGSAMVPLFNGTKQDWASTIKKNYLSKVLNRLTALGVAGDWQTMWQLVLKLVLTDGDLLMIPYIDRYGLPNLDFVEAHQIRSRDLQGFVKGGRFDGYPCEDGVIYDGTQNVIGYQIAGNTPDEDYTISSAKAHLIYSPFSFYKGRGKPLLVASSRHARNMIDYQHYIPQLVKIHSGIQAVETNLEGRAPAGRTAFTPKNPAVTTTGTDANGNPIQRPAVTEYFQGGFRYIKSNIGKLEPFKGTGPSEDIQKHIIATQKEMLCPIFPHQLLLSPETIGGPGSRGVKEILVAAIGTHRAMIEKYALIALQYVVAVGLNNTALQAAFNFQTNFTEDWADWNFTKAPEPSLDPGYERAADIADLKAGITSKGAIMAKEGKLEDDVNKDIDASARKTAALVEQFIADHPQLAAYAPQMYGLTEPAQVAVTDVAGQPRK